VHVCQGERRATKTELTGGECGQGRLLHASLSVVTRRHGEYGSSRCAPSMIDATCASGDRAIPAAKKPGDFCSRDSDRGEPSTSDCHAAHR
jgi:hypothetical protein